MPFQSKIFQEQISSLPDTTRQELVVHCQELATITSPSKKAHCIGELMQVLDESVEEGTRRIIMESCGRKCIGDSTLQIARRSQKEAQDIDDLLRRLNEAHIGGGRLAREGSAIHASYPRCYCGSVSQAREPISSTYCLCSCGWFRQLFETLLGHPVEVRLLSSIIQGDDQCRFIIDTGETV